jgi:hypothetical protein
MPYPTSGTQGLPIAGEPIVEELRIKTIDTGYAVPGRIVMRDTDDNHCKVAGAGEAAPIGVLMPVPKHDSDDDFTTEDWVRVGHGPGVVIPMMLTTGQTATKGAWLYPAAHGALKTTASSTEAPVAKAETSVTTTTLAEAAIIVRLAI